MAEQDVEKVREIFLQARELAGGERTSFVINACGANFGLRQEVEQLLAADAMETMEVVPAAAENTDDFPRLEGYRIVGRLGAGGMGVVWSAVQLSTRRPVALKLLSAASFGSERARLRFEREIELTAKLDHPHIARVYDSGVQHGVFFYAMQLIHGESLNRYAAARKLSRTQIIELMELICRAVQHAHQKGVIHRDLKHSNILVDEKGEPHVLDFGLAKALDSSQVISLDGEIAGTPAFMSPEQAAGKLDRLDTRSDVYTLGVILFHLLSGMFPHDVSGSAMEVMRRISEQEPKRLGDIQPHPDRELAALLSKALEKEPNRRYASAGELADDLRRYLDHDPLVAQPPTLTYLLSKKLRRHRLPLGVAAAVLALLGCVMVYAYARVLKERNSAVAARIEKESQRLEAERQRVEADRERRLALKALATLRETAPTFLARSQALVKERNFAEALKNASYAADLVPEDPAYQFARADALQSLYRFDDAAAAYRAAAALQPDNATAKENIDLCRRLALELKEKGELKPATLSVWQVALQRQKRFAEAMTVLSRVNDKDGQVDRYGEILKAAGVKGSLGYWDAEERGHHRHFFSSEMEEFIPDPHGSLLTLDTNSAASADRRDWSMLKGMPIEWLKLHGKVDDLTPLVGMPLKVLDLQNTEVSDLRPLAGMMSLRELYCAGAKVNDLGPLTGMPLTILQLGSSRPVADLTLTDLSPLHGMSLKVLVLGKYDKLDNIAPLQGMPLEILDLNGTKVRDLGPLRGMKLRSLDLHGCPVNDIGALAGMPLTTLKIAKTSVTDLGPLRGMPLKMLEMGHVAPGTAEILRSLSQLQRVDIHNGDDSDLEYLRTIHVTDVRLWSHTGADLSPLRGKPLETLELYNCDNVTDLTPLEGMPLKELSLPSCTAVRDLRPLLKCTQLERLSISYQCRDIEFLRQMSWLKYIVCDRHPPYMGPGDTAAEFWKHFDARKAAGK